MCTDQGWCRRRARRGREAAEPVLVKQDLASLPIEKRAHPKETNTKTTPKRKVRVYPFSNRTNYFHHAAASASNMGRCYWLLATGYWRWNVQAGKQNLKIDSKIGESENSGKGTRREG